MKLSENDVYIILVSFELFQDNKSSCLRVNLNDEPLEILNTSLSLSSEDFSRLNSSLMFRALRSRFVASLSKVALTFTSLGKALECFTLKISCRAVCLILFDKNRDSLFNMKVGTCPYHLN